MLGNIQIKVDVLRELISRAFTLSLSGCRRSG